MIIASDLKRLPEGYDETAFMDDRITSHLWSNLFISESNHSIRLRVLATTGTTIVGEHDEAVPNPPELDTVAGDVPAASESPPPMQPEARKTHGRLTLMDISNIEEIYQYLQSKSHVRAFFIRKMNSNRPLGVPLSMFQAICHGTHAPTKLRDFILFLGKRESRMKGNDSEMEIAFPPASFVITGAVEDKSHRLELLCGLRHVDLNDNDFAEWYLDRWSLRQSVIAGICNTHEECVSWLFFSISQTSERQLLRLWCQDDAQISMPPFRVLLSIFDVGVTNWRFYLADFAAEVVTHQGQVSGTLPDGSGPLQYATPEVRLRLLELDSRLLETRLALQATRGDLMAIGSACEESNACLANYPVQDHQHIVVAFTNLLREVDVHLLRVEHLQAKLQSITALVSNYLELENGLVLQRLAQDSKLENEAMRGLNQEMRDMAQNNARDSAKITVLTILTLVYLPLTVVSNFFSTSFVGTSHSGKRIFLTDDWWLLLVTALPLTVVTLYVWWAWSEFRSDHSYPCWWPSKYRQTRARVIGRAWHDRPVGDVQRPFERTGTFDERDNYLPTGPGNQP